MNYEEAIKHLKEYIEKDEIYQNQEKAESDFDKFCIEHCEAIEILLKEYDRLSVLLDETRQSEMVKEDRINKAIEYIKISKLDECAFEDMTDYSGDFAYIIAILKGE